MGLVFGALFEKSHVYEPMAIRGQFNFERWIMMKMFMGAVAGSCGSFASVFLMAMVFLLPFIAAYATRRASGVFATCRAGANRPN